VLIQFGSARRAGCLCRQQLATKLELKFDGTEAAFDVERMRKPDRRLRLPLSSGDLGGMQLSRLVTGPAGHCNTPIPGASAS